MVTTDHVGFGVYPEHLAFYTGVLINFKNILDVNNYWQEEKVQKWFDEECMVEMATRKAAKIVITECGFGKNRKTIKNKKS